MIIANSVPGVVTYDPFCSSFLPVPVNFLFFWLMSPSTPAALQPGLYSEVGVRADVVLVLQWPELSRLLL